MGEARRKAEAGRVSEALLAALAVRSVGGTSGVDAAQALVMDLARDGEARAALGGLPPLVEQSLAGVKELPADKGGAAKAVVWVRWPDGRQWAKLARSVGEVRDQGLKDLVLDATVRGHDLRVAAFPDDGWRDALDAVAAAQAPQRPDADALAEAAAAVKRSAEGNDFLVPRRDDPAARRAVAATLLRAFDALVADAPAFGASRATVFLEFAGHDDDPREFWDIEPCAELLRTLDRHAPWWPWVVDPAQNFAWLGALISTGPTTVSPNGEVAFPFDPQRFKALLQRTLPACAQAAYTVGIDPRTSSEVRAGIEEIRQRFLQTAQTLSQRTQGLEPI